MKVWCRKFLFDENVVHLWSCGLVGAEFCELPGMLCTSKELTTIEKTPLMSRKILTHNPGFLCLPTDLVTKHCHIKWWCLGEELCPHTLHPLPTLEMGLPV